MPNPPSTATHKIRFKPGAAKSMEEIRTGQPKVCKQIQEKVDELKKNKFPADSIKLNGSDTCYRVDSGEYRIVYEVLKTEIIVYVLKIGHRQGIYK